MAISEAERIRRAEELYYKRRYWTSRGKETARKTDKCLAGKNKKDKTI